jgi:hypothetical protein
MALKTPIDSNLQITIYGTSPDSDARDVISGFDAVMITKDVPTALWDVYSEGSDPNLTRNPEALRQPNQPTLSLCMGVSITIPRNLQFLSKSPVQQFDATVALRYSLGTFHIAWTEPVSQKLLPSGEFLPSSPGVERWPSFARVWMDAADSGKPLVGSVVTDDQGTVTQNEGLLKMAAHWLGWESPPPSADRPLAETLAGKRLPWQLTGELPKYLVASLGSEYRVLPRENTTSI